MRKILGLITIGLCCYNYAYAQQSVNTGVNGVGVTKSMETSVSADFTFTCKTANHTCTQQDGDLLSGNNQFNLVVTENQYTVKFECQNAVITGHQFEVVSGTVDENIKNSTSSSYTLAGYSGDGRISIQSISCGDASNTM